MPLTRAESDRAEELEALARRRDLSPAEMEDYHRLALNSHSRVLLARAQATAHDRERVDGYRDGRDPEAPEPSENRSASYRHGFKVGRAELAREPAFGSAAEARRRAAAAEAEDGAR